MATNPQSRSGELAPADGIEPDLVSALTKVIDGINDANNHYTVSANYYDHQSSERSGERWYVAQIWPGHAWLNADTASHIVLTDQGLICDVRLNRHDRSQVSRILLPYGQIWSIQSISSKHLNLYHRSDKLNLKRPNDGD